MADGPEPDKKHPEYTDNLAVWQKCRDAAAGERAIKKGRTLYLPALAGHIIINVLQPAYLNYLARASYFNATGRTVEAMTGMVFRKQMKVEAPQVVQDEWLNDITLTEETLEDFAKECFAEVLTVDRVGVLVDMPTLNPGEVVTRAQSDAQQRRPYFSLYKTESIINWEMARINNQYRLKNVWLEETYVENGKDETQVRQLTLDNGYYEQVIWRKEADTARWVVSSRTPALKNGANVYEIPFFPVSSKKPTLKVGVPPIESLADVNISHFRNSADLENGAHLAGQPTPVITGHRPETQDNGTSEPIELGSSTAIILPEAEAKAYFLQCGSEGFASLEKLMASKVAMMAALGARMLAPEKKDAEAAETHEIKRGGENSVISSIAGILERQLERALQFAAEWQGIAGEVTLELNRDYIPWDIDLTAWLAMVQSGKISHQTYFDGLKYAEVIDENLTFEEEQERIKNDGPPLSTLKQGE